MSVILNSWIEKCKKKKQTETAPAFESNPSAVSEIYNTKKPLKRFTIAAHSVVMRTLRGIRK